MGHGRRTPMTVRAARTERETTGLAPPPPSQPKCCNRLGRVQRHRGRRKGARLSREEHRPGLLEQVDVPENSGRDAVEAGSKMNQYRQPAHSDGMNPHGQPRPDWNRTTGTTGNKKECCRGTAPQAWGGRCRKQMFALDSERRNQAADERTRFGARTGTACASERQKGEDWTSE
eukprot:4467980-Pleurochrysis_carterae.AAC.4